MFGLMNDHVNRWLLSSQEKMRFLMKKWYFVLKINQQICYRSIIMLLQNIRPKPSREGIERVQGCLSGDLFKT